jgi:hypothetical protein
MGAALASLLTEMLVVLLTGTLAYREIRFVPSFENIGRIALSGAAMATALFFLEPFSFLLSGVVGVATYIFVLWLTNAVNHTELISLFQKNNSSPEEAEHMETMLP